MSSGLSAFRELSVLIVDDNQHMRNLLLSILRSMGIRNVRECGDVEEALEEWVRAPADLIITDWHMEPRDGIDLVKLVRTAEDSPNPYVPIIMLTGHADVQHVVEARDAGVNEFLAKPIAANSLYSRMVSSIERPRPFVRTATYFGPDRRRQDVGPPPGVQDRRQGARFDTAEPTNSAARDEDESLQSG